MKLQLTHIRCRAFTGWDLLVIVATVLFAIGFLFMPRSGGGKTKASRINCVSNIKQIGLAFRMWANDHGEVFPMNSSVSSTNGGTLEFALTGEVWKHFQIISNEVNTPKVFFCPEDKKRSRTANWQEFTNNSHLSYFVGLDADETNPQSILSGDRNLTSTTVKPVKGVLNITANDRVEWTKEIHKEAGNIGLGDGSAHQFSAYTLSKQFQATFNSTTQAVHRLALPE